MTDEAPCLNSSWRQRYGPWLALLLFIGLFAVSKLTGVWDRLDTETVRSAIVAAGAWGVFAFILIFALGELMHVPGMVFVAAGMLAYGGTLGFVICLVAALVSVSASFVIVRAVGGRALAGMRSAFMQRMLDRLDKSPALTVAALRSVFWLAPPLNYALAMTNISFRDHLLCSTAGLIAPILAASVFFDWIFG